MKKRLGLAAMFILPFALPAWANLENTVTVKGSTQGQVDNVVASTSLSIPVVPAAPALSVAIIADPAGNVAPGDRVALTYRLENTGNVTLSNVTLQVEQEGMGAPPVPSLAETESEEPAAADGEAQAEEAGAPATFPGTLAPGEAAIFAASYVVVQEDLENNGGGDGVLGGRVMASGNFADLEATAEAELQIALTEIIASLEVTKTADRTENLAAGDVVTYTYTVTNTGNVAITAISLTETHNGSGPAPRPAGEQLLTDNGIAGDSSDREADGSWDLLGPGDSITFTATYTVTQPDIDRLQ